MSKYNNKKTYVDGIKFDSKKEANRYCELKLMERCKAISNLELQVPYILYPKRDGLRAVKYVADFRYVEDGKTVVEDVKGVLTDVYKLKKRMMLEVHGIEIKET